MQIDNGDSFLIEIGMKVAGFFISFITGVFMAGWVFSSKVKGFDDRLLSVEALQQKCQNSTLARIDEKLDSIHRRIDDVLIRGDKN